VVEFEQYAQKVTVEVGMQTSCGCDGTGTQMTTKQLQGPTICFLSGVISSAHPDCRLHTGSLLRTLCSVAELRQKGHFPTTSPPAQGAFPVCALEACTF